jgi:hypothetical protein
METKVYKSKFGWAVFLFMTALFTVIFWMNFDYEEGPWGAFSLVLVFGGILGLFSILSVSTRYTISATSLHIRCLPFYNKIIEMTAITKVAVTRNLISSPAPSLDRIEVYFGKYDSIVISPKDKLQFMEDLKKANPSIHLVTS